MTVGIGVICENGQAVVVAADRTVSVDTPWIEHESDNRKITHIDGRVLVSSTGTYGEASHVLESLRGDASGTTREFAERLRKSRERLRWRNSEAVVRRHFGISLREFRSSKGPDGKNPFVEEVTKLLLQPLALMFIVAGIDDTGGHVFGINDYGVPQSYDDVGFVTVGSGGAQALSSLARREYSKRQSLPESLLSVFDAKRAAELAVGVGRTTDIGVIRSGGRAAFLSNEAVEQLGKIHDSLRPPAPSDEQLRAISDSLPC